MEESQRDVLVLENKISEVENELCEGSDETSGGTDCFGHCSCRFGSSVWTLVLKVQLDLLEVENRGAQVSSGLQWIKAVRLWTKALCVVLESRSQGEGRSAETIGRHAGVLVVERGHGREQGEFELRSRCLSQARVALFLCMTVMF